jgi:hypothetical protein
MAFLRHDCGWRRSGNFCSAITMASARWHGVWLDETVVKWMCRDLALDETDWLRNSERLSKLVELFAQCELK